MTPGRAKVLIVVFLAVMLLPGCTQTQPPSSPPASVTQPQDNATPPGGTNVTPPGAMLQKGVSLSPRSFEGEDFTDFFVEARQAGNIVMWAGDWNGLGADGAPKTVTELASAYHYTPLIEVTYYDQGEGRLLRPLDDATKERYKNSAAAFAGKYHPRYLGIGIEVNIMYEKSPEDFAEFVVLYNDVYDAVKAVSPDTKVFTVFQLEEMKGLDFWSTDQPDPARAQWQLINEFKSDIAAFTTYPGLVYKDPSEMPADYYNEIKTHTSKPIAFTEVGWHSDASPAGWESSEAEQAQFVDRFFSLTGSLNREMVIWSFMYDQNTIEPFKSMGLRRSDGTAKEAWAIWLDAG